MKQKPILKVLLIEDNVADEYFVKEALEKSNGFELVMKRVDTEDTLRLALRDVWDFVITDIRLPKISIEKILEILASSDIEALIVLISGSVHPDEVKVIIGSQTAYPYVNKVDLWQLGPLLKRTRELEDAHYSVIQAFIEALDLRDQNTQAHSRRVVELSEKVAVLMGLSEREIRRLKRGALLHDIGKVGIADSILLKPGPLDPEEFAVMQTHSRKGYELLTSIPSLRNLADVAYCHHEKWNGTGYPRGLMGEAIPLHARIFSVVDVYDALTSLRPYREPMPQGNALDYIQNEAGISFDPQVVKAFMELFK